MSNVVIVGGGFAGLTAAEVLSDSIGPGHRVTLVTPKSSFTFYPGLIHVAFNRADVSDLTIDLEARLDDLGVRFISGEATGIDSSRRRLRIAGKEFNGEISYDYLLIATGRRLATEKLHGFFDHAHHLLGVTAAQRLKEALASFKKGKIVVGVAPGAELPVAACESAFAAARMFDEQVKSGEVSIDLVFPGSIEESFGGAPIYSEVEAALRSHGIVFMSGFRSTRIEKDELVSGHGTKIPYDLLIMLPPFAGHAFLAKLQANSDKGFLLTDEFMRVRQHDRVYAAGDIVELPGPKLAYCAVEQARVAASNIASVMQGEEPVETYFHEIAAIIDSGGEESIYLNYGIWDKTLHRIKTGRFWHFAKRVHDKLWKQRHG